MKTEQMQVDSTKFSGRLVQNGNEGLGKDLCIDHTKRAAVWAVRTGKKN